MNNISKSKHPSGQLQQSLLDLSRAVLVTEVGDGVGLHDLEMHFLRAKHGGQGDVERVAWWGGVGESESRTAVVVFERPETALKVLKRNHVLKCEGQEYRLCVCSATQFLGQTEVCVDERVVGLMHDFLSSCDVHTGSLRLMKPAGRTPWKLKGPFHLIERVHQAFQKKLLASAGLPTAGQSPNLPLNRLSSEELRAFRNSEESDNSYDESDREEEVTRSPSARTPRERVPRRHRLGPPQTHANQDSGCVGDDLSSQEEDEVEFRSPSADHQRPYTVSAADWNQPTPDANRQTSEPPFFKPTPKVDDGGWMYTAPGYHDYIDGPTTVDSLDRILDHLAELSKSQNDLVGDLTECGSAKALSCSDLAPNDLSVAFYVSTDDLGTDGDDSASATALSVQHSPRERTLTRDESRRSSDPIESAPRNVPSISSSTARLLKHETTLVAHSCPQKLNIAIREITSDVDVVRPTAAPQALPVTVTASWQNVRNPREDAESVERQIKLLSVQSKGKTIVQTFRGLSNGTPEKSASEPSSDFDDTSDTAKEDTDTSMREQTLFVSRKASNTFAENCYVCGRLLTDNLDSPDGPWTRLRVCGHRFHQSCLDKSRTPEVKPECAERVRKKSIPALDHCLDGPGAGSGCGDRLGPGLDVCKNAGPVPNCRDPSRSPKSGSNCLDRSKNLGAGSNWGLCPKCHKPYGIRLGVQPSQGNMWCEITHRRLKGLGWSDWFKVHYEFPGGLQGASGLSPGASYMGTFKQAYVPKSPAGEVIVRMLEVAFDNRLTFNFRPPAKDSTIWSLNFAIEHIASLKDCNGEEAWLAYMQRLEDQLNRLGIYRKMVDIDN